MTQSPEYPDLLWVAPNSWTDANRTAVQLVVIHTTEGSSQGQSAEDGAAYDQRRTDGTSTHYFHDSNSTVQCVRTADQAHAARAQGNRRGIHHELCAKAGAQDWASPYSQAMLSQAARQCARDAVKWGIPVRHLTVDQVAAGVKGFCAHYDITRAFPQDGGTHTDPGPMFPWSQFLDMVRAEMGEDMTTKAEFIGWLKDPEVAKALCWAVFNTDDVIPAPGNPAPGDNTHLTGSSYVRGTYVEAQRARVLAGQGADSTADILTGQDALAAKIAAQVLQGLPQGSGPVSPDVLTGALKAAFRDAFSAA